MMTVDGTCLPSTVFFYACPGLHKLVLVKHFPVEQEADDEG